MSSTLNKFLKDTIWSFASLAISSGLIFILRIFLARYYGAGDLGLYTLSFTVYSLGLALSGFGMGAGITKYVAEKLENATYIRLLTTGGVSISLITGFCAGLIVYIASPYLAVYFFKMPELTLLFRIVSLSFPFIALEKATLGLLNGIRQMRLYAFINIAQNILVIILTIFFAIARYDIKYAVLGFVLPTVILSLISLYYVRNYLQILSPKTWAPTTKVLLIFGFWGSLSNSLGFIQTYTNTTILGYFMSNIDVGIFGVTTTLLLIIGLPSMAIQMITFPLISNYWAKKETIDIEYLSNKCMKWSALYAVIVAFILGLLSQEILRLIFGTEFLSAAPLLQIMLFGAVLSAIQSSIGTALASTAFVKILFMLTGVNVVINIILNIFLIAHLGMTGAALATLISTIIFSMTSIYFTQHLIKIKIDWIWFIKLFGFTLLLGLCTILLGRLYNLYLASVVATISLIIVMFKFFLSQQDRRLLKNIIGRKNI